MIEYLPKILVVDDYSANLAAMNKLLANCSAEIFTSSSGNEALTQTLNNDFALILLDVQMPGMSGFETAEILRSNEATQTTPIIFLTAFNKDEHDVFQGYDSGAVDYMFKPVDPVILISKVTIFLKLDRQKKELELTRDEMALEIQRRIHAESEKNKLIDSLQEALREVKALRGILPICAKCHKIRNDQGYWQQIEQYFREHSELLFSHGLCESCSEDLYGGEAWYKKKS